MKQCSGMAITKLFIERVNIANWGDGIVDLRQKGNKLLIGQFDNKEGFSLATFLITCDGQENVPEIC